MTMEFFKTLVSALHAVEDVFEHTTAGRLLEAVRRSPDMAESALECQLQGVITLRGIFNLLTDTLEMIGLSYAVGIGTGAAGGAVIGAFAGGMGALPGAAIGADAGLAITTWVLNGLGLSVIAVETFKRMDKAFDLYYEGFHDATRKTSNREAEMNNIFQASGLIGLGHAELLKGLIFGIVTYMSRGAASKERALIALRQSRLMGGEVTAGWFERNFTVLDEFRRRPSPLQKAMEEVKTREQQLRKERERDAPVASNPRPEDKPRYSGARGQYSGRPFDLSKAGGPIEYLTTKGVKITHDGISAVEKHVSRFRSDPANSFMTDRLKKIADGKLEPTQYDLNYYTHELREFQRYKNLGWETGEPEGMEGYDLWNNAHTATLEDFRLKDKDIYHPDAPNE